MKGPSSFFRLHPNLQHAIVHDLGFRSLRPVQEMAADAVLDGDNAVVLAPTAGGKTEAALFPVLSRILSEQLAPVAALYICPIRALLNNLEDRVKQCAAMVGLSAFKWHGDVGASARARFARDPGHVLLITPESLEVMLIGQHREARELLTRLGVVIIDEVHAFAADDRGAHLAALLERLVALTGKDLQRIGLSATVGNPPLIGEWLAGSSARPFRLVDPPRPALSREVAIDYRDGTGPAAAAISSLARGKKSLVFVESRSRAEHVAQALHGSSVEVFIHHSAVSRADRALAEEQFAKGRNTAIVCTSTMELGIDVGDLDQVIQVDAPATVASFLQRVGRTGRRAGAPQRCAFFCLTPESLLQAIAVATLAERGWVEDVRPAKLAMHVLAHQVMALILQEGGISRHRLLPWIEAAYPFCGIRPERLQELVDTMCARAILHEADGTLTLGSRGEKLYGRKNFFELYAVFTSPPMLRVLHGKDEVGTLAALFVAAHDHAQGPLCFRLGGRAWEAVRLDWGRGTLDARPADRGRVPAWIGTPGAVSEMICRTMRGVLARPGPEVKWLSPAAAEQLGALREGYSGLLEDGTAPIEETPEGVRWHTFAGGTINRVLAAGLTTATGKRFVAGNLSIQGRDAGLVEASDAIRSLGGMDWERVASEAAAGMARGPISKFQPCLPEDAEDRLLVERLLDVPGTLHFLRHSSLVRPPGTPAPSGARLRDAELTAPGLSVAMTVPRAGAAIQAPRVPIRWVDSQSALEAVAGALRSVEVIGLDVETTLDFGTLCLVQVATPDVTYLIDPLAVTTLAALSELLGSERPIKVIHNARFERRVLASHGLVLRGVFDTLDASRRIRGNAVLGGHGLGVVCERELGITLDKTEQTSSWAARPLSASQIRYAALDAEVLLLLRERLAPLSAPSSA